MFNSRSDRSDQKFDPVVANLTNSTELFCGFIPAVECNRNNTHDLYTIFGSDQTVSNYKAPEATLQMNYDAGGVKLTSITGWRKSTEAQTQDYDGSSTDLYFTDRRQHYAQWSQELRLSGDVGTFDYVVGAYAFNSKYDLTQWSRVFGFNPAVPPTLFDRNSQHVEGNRPAMPSLAISTGRLRISGACPLVGGGATTTRSCSMASHRTF